MKFNNVSHCIIKGLVWIVQEYLCNMPMMHLNYGGNVYNYGVSAADRFFGTNGSVQIGNGEISIKYGDPKDISQQLEVPKPEMIPLLRGNPEGEGVIQ